MAGELSWWSGTEAGHQLLHVLHAGGAGHGERELQFGMVAVLPVEVVELFVGSVFLAALQVAASSARSMEATAASLSRNVSADEVAVGFFAAEDEVVGAGGVDFPGRSI